MRTLTLTLPPSSPTAAASAVAVLSHDGTLVSRHVEVPLALLPPSEGSEVVAVVPASKLSWHALELPRGTLDKKLFQEGDGARLRSVLDGLLEDRVLDEPAQLHFAIAPMARTGAPMWVAVCDRAWLHAWLAAMEQSGHSAVRIVPEVAPPAEPHAGASALYFTGTSASTQIIYSGPHGVWLLPYGAAAMALVNGAGEGPAQVWAEPAVAELAEQHFEGRVTLQSNAQRFLAAAQSEWDLAQFDCSASRSARSRKKISHFFATLLSAPRWRAARWMALALLLVNLSGIALWNWSEQSSLAAKRMSVRQLLTSTFPEVRVVVDAPLQMARSVADLQRQNGAVTGADLETMLVQYYSMSSGMPLPTAIEFADGELKLKGLNPEAAQRARITAKLEGLRYRARMDGDTLTLQLERQP
ncbi:MAG: general secretion pathway protein GspL [Rhodoferax sp.]|nr:general secretion pathway protein GspL [Rhodoferax sp.]MCF8208349.1 general secretion pathway protein GspL [Rhodoferax sp.]